MTPAKLKRNALCAHLLSSKSAKSKSTGSAASAESATEAGFAEKDGRKQLVLTATSPEIDYSFLGEDCCARSFRIFTGIGGLHRHTKKIRQGVGDIRRRPIEEGGPPARPNKACYLVRRPSLAPPKSVCIPSRRRENMVRPISPESVPLEIGFGLAHHPVASGVARVPGVSGVSGVAGVTEVTVVTTAQGGPLH